MSLILIVLVVVAIVIFQRDKKEEVSNIAEKINSNQQQEIEGLVFPYVLEDEALEISSVFSYSGTNPDFDDEDCENVGAVQIINKSQKYMKKADIIVTLSDGSKLQFLLEDIPAGKEVMAFEIHNAEYDQSMTVLDIQADVQRVTEKNIDKEVVTYETGEEDIKITNVSDKSLVDVIVKYHCSLNEMYFGGKCFEDVIEVLQPNEKAVVDASECYLGEVTVVDITY